MNARQKAKKLKKELDFYKNQPFRETYKVTNIPADYLKANVHIHQDDLEAMENRAEGFIRDNLSQQFKEAVKDRLVIREEPDVYERGLVFSADIFIGFGRG